MIISLIIYVFVSFIMVGIGVSQLKSRIVYGAVILLSWVVGFLVEESFWQGVSLIAGVCLPLIFMIMYHSALVKRYKK
jgi:hypothetical protein